MWKDLKISIALCTYNGERFLREQLESYSRQTCLPDEVIVCDDGSTDATLSILESWAKSVPFNVQIVQNPQNLGYAQNFGKAVSLCTGDVIFLSDQDDVWEPEKIEKMTRVFEEEPEVGVVTTDSYIIDEHGTVQPGGSWELASGWRYDEAVAFGIDQPFDEIVCTRGCATAIRREFCKVYLPVPANWTHDLWLMVLAPWFWKTRFLPDRLFRYRLYDANTSNAGSFEDRLNRVIWKRDNYYWNTETQYWAWLPLIEKLKERLEGFLPEKKLSKCRHFFRRLDRYYTYRNRCQRSFLKFGIFWVLLLFSGLYFRFPFPWKCIFYDLRTGLKSTFNLKKP